MRQNCGALQKKMQKIRKNSEKNMKNCRNPILVWGLPNEANLWSVAAKKIPKKFREK
jgi:hypothetical protein